MCFPYLNYDQYLNGVPVCYSIADSGYPSNNLMIWTLVFNSLILFKFKD